VRTILLLAVNPVGTQQLRLDEEVKRIEQVVERSRRRDEFRVVQKWAVTPDDLRRALLDHGPEVVHFLGHGASSCEPAVQTSGTRDLASRDSEPRGGLAFENDAGSILTISGDALGRLFQLVSLQVHCVVLNACYSSLVAGVISQHIDYVIGMNKAIGDRAAVNFAVGFYDALLAGRPYEEAFGFGRSAIDLSGIPEHLTPTLFKRAGAGSSPLIAGAPPPLATDTSTPADVTPRANSPAQHSTRPASQPRPAAIDSADLRRVRRALRKYLGPGADYIVEEKAEKSGNLKELCKRVAAEIRSPEDAAEFLESMGISH